MSETDKVELQLEVIVPDSTEEELDRMTRQLLVELRQLNTEFVDLAKGGPALDGTKGDPVTIGAIVLEALPVAIPSIIGLVQAWALRSQGRTVKFKSKGIEFEGSPEELQKLLATLEKRKGKK